MILSGDSGVLSTRSSSSVSFLCMTSTASSVGTLVNSEVTSRASSASIRSSFTTPVKCLEFRTCEVVLPARGEITDATYLESLS